MTVTEELVREQLRKVIDPELFVNIVDLGLIYVVALEEGAAAATAEADAASDNPPIAEDSAEGSADEAAISASADSTASDAAEGETAPSGPVTNVKIDMTMTSPMCPAGPQLVGDSRNAVSGMEQVEEVDGGRIAHELCEALVEADLTGHEHVLMGQFVKDSLHHLDFVGPQHR